ncbi:hypothetical protein GQ457_18G000320 [Hibiscus cannabinus]
MCGIGVGLFSDVDSIEDKRKEIGVAVSKLQKSGLLLEADGGRRVRMHDVVRDFAHWLTSQGENRFMVKDRVKEWPNVLVRLLSSQKACTLMNCQKQIQLGVLSEKEGWGLFKANAGLEDGYSTLNAVAKKVAGECRGLPLAIVTVAKALKGESLEGWRAANRRLKDSRHLSNEDVFGSVYRALKLSYDYLEKDNNRTTENEIQLCFLLCSLFPEDYEILIEILIMSFLQERCLSLLPLQLGLVRQPNLFFNKSISIRLDETNYLLWRQQVLFAIDSLALGSHIDGSAVVPSQTALEIWDKIQQNFSIFSTTKIMHLHCSLKNLRKRDQSMREYLAQIQSICDSLAACGNPLTETMHISTILSGLPSEYEPVVAVITSSQQPYKLDGVCSVLLDTEARQQEVHSIPVNLAQGSFGFGNNFSNNLSSFPSPILGSWGEIGPAGFVGQASSVDGNGAQGYGSSRRFSQEGFRSQRVSSVNPNSFQGGRSNFYRGRGGRVFGGRSRPQCQLCGRVGHLVNRCYYRFNQSYDGFYSANFVEEAVETPGFSSEPSSTQELEGSVALVSGDFSPIVCEDASWFPDSGATAHLTPDAGMLHNSIPYNGAGKISVANGPSDSAVSSILGVSKSSVLEDIACLSEEADGVTSAKFMVPKLWNDGSFSRVQRSTGTDVASKSLEVQVQQHRDQIQQHSSPVGGAAPLVDTEVPSVCVEAPAGVGLVRGSQSAPIVYKRKAKTMAGGDLNLQSVQRNPTVHSPGQRVSADCFADQGVSADQNISASHSPLQSVSAEDHPARSGCSSSSTGCGLSSGCTPSSPNHCFPSVAADQSVHKNSAPANIGASKEATGATSFNPVFDRNVDLRQATSFHPMVTRSKTGSLKPKAFLVEEVVKGDCVPEPKNVLQALELFSDVDSIEDKRKEIGVAVSKLQKSGLLLEVDGGRRVRMHDVVRDFAHWLTSQGENRFMVKDRVKEWSNVVASLGCYTAIALWNCSCLNHFPRNVKFSKLKTLFLEGKNLQSVPSTCFEEMEALQVLFLKDVSFSLEGLQSLTNLRTLCCVECKLGNCSSSLRNLRNLEILALFYTNIDEIPENLVELPSLKSLYLSHDEERRIISFPLALWSRLSSLQELHVMSENNVNLMELNSLSDLTSLSLRVSANRYVGEDFIFPKLERYVIVFNKHLDVWQGLTFRTLEIKSLSSSLSAFKNLFHNVEILRLEQVQKLTSLPLIKSRDEEEPQLFSNLIFLNLKSLPQLESIWELQPSCHVIASFRNLKVVTIENCHKLKVIFSPCIAQSMVHLQQLCVFSCEGLEQVIGFSQEEENIELWVEYCPRLTGFAVQSQVMEELYLDDVGKRCQLCRTDVNQDCILVGNHEEVFWVQGGDSFSSIKQVHLRNLSEVQIIWKDLAGFVTLDNLTSLKLYVCEKLKYIFSPWTARSLSRLANLYIMGCEESEGIILGMDQISSSSNVDTALQPISFPSLTQIEVTFCNNLRGLFPLGSATSLQQLKCLKVENNMKLEQVFEVEEVTTKDIEFDKLEFLKLEDLPCLIGFSSKGYHSVFPGLNNLEATRCPKMTTTFSIDSKQIVHSKTEPPPPSPLPPSLRCSSDDDNFEVCCLSHEELRPHHRDLTLEPPAAVDRRPGGYSGRARPSFKSPRHPPSSPRISFARSSPDIHGNNFEGSTSPPPIYFSRRWIVMVLTYVDVIVESYLLTVAICHRSFQSPATRVTEMGAGGCWELEWGSMEMGNGGQAAVRRGQRRVTGAAGVPGGCHGG